jgi:hypothetical protein
VTPSSSTELPHQGGLAETLIRVPDDLEATVYLGKAPPSRLFCAEAVTRLKP